MTLLKYFWIRQLFSIFFFENTKNDKLSELIENFISKTKKMFFWIIIKSDSNKKEMIF